MISVLCIKDTYFINYSTSPYPLNVLCALLYTEATLQATQGINSTKAHEPWYYCYIYGRSAELYEAVPQARVIPLGLQARLLKFSKTSHCVHRPVRLSAHPPQPLHSLLLGWLQWFQKSAPMKNLRKRRTNGCLRLRLEGSFCPSPRQGLWPIEVASMPSSLLSGTFLVGQLLARYKWSYVLLSVLVVVGPGPVLCLHISPRQPRLNDIS